MYPTTRPDWLEAALERHAPAAARAADRVTRARLQAALRSTDPAVRANAKAEVVKKVQNPVKQRR